MREIDMKDVVAPSKKNGKVVLSKKTDSNVKHGKETVAKVIINGKNEELYFVLVDRNNKLYDPKKANNTYGATIVDRVTGKPMFNYKQCNEPTFAKYKKFIESGVDMNLRIAQGYLDGEK